MIKPNQLSKCHNAPVVVCEGGAWDVKTVRRGSTYYYGCTECKEACDVSSDTNELDTTQLVELWNALDDHFDTGVLDDEGIDHINNTVLRICSQKEAEAYKKGYIDGGVQAINKGYADGLIELKGDI